MIRRSSLFVVAVALMFTLSGATALVYQAVLNKFFAYIFGVSSLAAATVLAAFMSGLAMGSAVVGKLSSVRVRRHILWYGLFEAAIGLTGLVILKVAGFVEGWLGGFAGSFAALTAMRFVMAIVLVWIPTFLMGGSLPLLVEGILRRGVQQRINVLYALNVAGAAIGTVVAAYWLLPTAHLDGAMRLVFAIDLVVLAGAFGIERAWPAAAPWELPAKKEAAEDKLGEALPRFAIALAFFSGFITFTNEVLWYHLLSLVIGMTTYAYAIMLFTTLVGMAGAGFFVHKYVGGRSQHRRALSFAQLALGVSTMVTLPFWDRAPNVFLQLGVFVTSFVGMEITRFVACFALIALPALSAGLTFPILLDLAETKAKVGHAVGRLYAVNTIGSVFGSLVAGFVVLRVFGGRTGLIVSAFASAIVGIALLEGAWRARLRPLLSTAAVFAVVLWLFPTWDIKALLSGASIYFSQAHEDFDEVVWQREDSVGGITSVIRRGKTLTMLTNGKFQGNNTTEIPEQMHLALVPNLFVKDTNRALNIGLGPGGSLGVIAQFPYKHIDAVELSPDVVDSARRLFPDVNKGSLDDPRVTVHMEDGRNFLLRGREPYDLVSIQISSIWFAGAGNLYNDEFYRLVAKNLTQRGVFQQWVQLHHISAVDVASIVKTFRKHFEHVQLWLPGHQAVLLGSHSPLVISEDRVRDIEAKFNPSELPYGSPYALAGTVLLQDRGVDEFLAGVEKEHPVPLSTDENMYLEYATPYGNTLGWNFTQNFDRMLAYSSPDFSALLPAAVRSDAKVQAIGNLGRAWFAPKFSREWHDQVERAIRSVPSEAERADLRRRVIEETGGAKPGPS